MRLRQFTLPVLVGIVLSNLQWAGLSGRAVPRPCSGQKWVARTAKARRQESLGSRFKAWSQQPQQPVPLRFAGLPFSREPR